MIFKHEEPEWYFKIGTIIDLETIGKFNKRYKNYMQYKEVYPVIFGVITNQGMIIKYITHVDDIDELLDVIKCDLRKLPRPLWAFNCIFEQGIIKARFGMTIKFKELNAWRYESKRSAVKLFRISNFGDPFHGHGELVVDTWPEYYDKCVKHNRACLLKELEIWKHRFQAEFKYMEVP
ncbi:MAG: hypothetical protein EAX96_14890 [Candidatus Lokiarchaeota archaeon]|nr:hypothetical protein [Candidatus Lokiarchaeota archaeon]